MISEHHHFTYLSSYLVSFYLFAKKPAQTFRGNISRFIYGIYSFACVCYGRFINISSEYLYFGCVNCVLYIFRAQHGNGICFFPGSAAGYPYSYGFVGAFIFNYLWNYFPVQGSQTLFYRERKL